MPATNPGTTGLVAWWSLESDGTDSTGRGNTLTNSGAGFVAGLVGNAADLELTESDYLSRADNADLSMGDNDITVCAWVNMESSFAVAGNILSKGSSASSATEYAMDYVNAAYFRFFIGSAGGWKIANGTTFGAATTGVWYFVVGRHDAAADTVSVCVNAGTANSASTGGATGLDTANSFYLGVLTSSYYWDGLIDEVCIYKRVLTADEITWLYNSGAGRTYADLAEGQPLRARVQAVPFHAARLTPGWRPGR